MDNEKDMDSLYGEAENEPSKSVDQEEAEEATKTAVISNKILDPHQEGLKEGDEIVLRVVKTYGDEAEVEYAPKKGKEEKDEGDSTEKDLMALNQEGSY